MRSKNKMALRNYLFSRGFIPKKGIWIGFNGERNKIKKNGKYFSIKKVAA
ncbi:hypothetical protein VP236O401_P0050 [Vibrio phage 236O40-1]|nr:hypothetical protein VP236O401_P0050 [Vibrio phage 236O40-1]